MRYGEPVTLMYAEERASWIRTNARWKTFQRTRADLLQLAYDEQRRRASGAAPNPHPQSITEYFWLRAATSRAGMVEAVVVVGAGVLFPIAWPAGRALYRWLARRITPEPESLHSIPITALAWIGTVFMVLSALVVNPSGAATMAHAVVLPWVLTQGAGTFMMASAYGVLEGWLAVAGSTDLWPLPPPPLPEERSFTKERRNRTSGAATPPGRHDSTPMRSPRTEAKKPWETG